MDGYRCWNCSFATVSTVRFNGHLEATGHAAASVPHTALDDRRQRAREAAYDARMSAAGDDDVAITVGIETATRVQITSEMLDAMNPAVGNRETRLRAAFEAAGFEVEQ